MAVPNTTTFSLQDVVDEINPTTDDLVDCVSDAQSGNYDGSYYSSPATSLLEFRNYGAVAPTITLTSSFFNFVVGNASVFQSIQLEFEYVSQTFTGTAAVVTASGTAQSVGATKIVNASGGPGTIWNANAFSGIFTVANPTSGTATVTMGLKINSTGTDTFPTGQITITRSFS